MPLLSVSSSAPALKLIVTICLVAYLPPIRASYLSGYGPYLCAVKSLQYIIAYNPSSSQPEQLQASQIPGPRPPIPPPTWLTPVPLRAWSLGFGAAS